MLRAKGQLTLPPEIRATLHVDEGDEIEFTVMDAGEVLLRGMTSVSAGDANLPIFYRIHTSSRGWPSNVAQPARSRPSGSSAPMSPTRQG
jgi:AbrB family looped-hinge helix DNA binding protein